MSTTRYAYDGSVIAALRQERGWSQDDVIFEMRKAGHGVSKPTLSKDENQKGGAPPADRVAAYATVFGVEPARFFVAEDMAA